MSLLPFEVNLIENPFIEQIEEELGVNGSMVDRLNEERQLLDVAMMGAADKGGKSITRPPVEHRLVDTGLTKLKSGGDSTEHSGPVTRSKPATTEEPKKEKPKS